MYTFDFGENDPDQPNVAFLPFWEEIYRNPYYTEILDKNGNKMYNQIIEVHCPVNVTAIKELVEMRFKK